MAACSVHSREVKGSSPFPATSYYGGSMKKRRVNKYNDDIKEKAFALLAVNNNVQYVADKLKLPYTTVKTWEKKFLAQAKKSGQEGGESSDSITNSLVEVRNKKKEEFVNNAWKLIGDSLEVAQKRITRAKDLEDNIDIVAEAIKKNAGKIEEETGIGWFDLLNLIRELQALKTPKISELSTLIGTIYDKQALANKEATAIIDGQLNFKKFEDF